MIDLYGYKIKGLRCRPRPEYGDQIIGWRKSLFTVPDGQAFLLLLQALGVYLCCLGVLPGTDRGHVLEEAFPLTTAPWQITASSNTVTLNSRLTVGNLPTWALIQDLELS